MVQVRQVLDGGTALPPSPSPPGPRRRTLLAGGTAALLAVTGAAAWQWHARRAEALAAIVGLWRIEASGDMLRSTLDLRVTGGELEGTAEIHYPDHPDFVFSGLYAQRKVPIADARWDGELLAFVTRRRFRKSLTGGSPETTQVLNYRGRLRAGALALTIEVEGGPTVNAEARRPPVPP